MKNVRIGDKVRVINDHELVEATVHRIDDNGIVELRDLVKRVPGYLLVHPMNLEPVPGSVAAGPNT